MLHSLFGFRKESGTTVEFSNKQVLFRLQQAKQRRAFVEISLPHDDTVYQSLLLELDAEEGTLLIDELFPGTGFVAPGDNLRISIRQHGGPSLKFQSRVMEVYSHDDAPLYVIAMPAFIDHDQRRNAYRLPVESRQVAEVDFTAPDNKIYSGRMGDISASGLSLFLSEPPACDLAYGSRLSNVNFEIGQLNINSDLIIRNLPSELEPEAKLRIGAEFDGLTPRQARELEVTILQLQRERLRRGEAMREQLIN